MMTPLHDRETDIMPNGVSPVMSIHRQVLGEHTKNGDRRNLQYESCGLLTNLRRGSNIYATLKTRGRRSIYYKYCNICPIVEEHLARGGRRSQRATLRRGCLDPLGYFTFPRPPSAPSWKGDHWLPLPRILKVGVITYLHCLVVVVVQGIKV